MKYLLTPMLIIGSFLFSSETFSEETQRNFKPCQIMMDQFDAYAKIDPLKGEGGDYFYVPGNDDTFFDEHREERVERSFINRAMKPGIGKAYFRPAQFGTENLNKLFEQENIRFSYVPITIWAERYGFANLQFYDLIKNSGYVIVISSGGTARCIYSRTLKITKAADGYILNEPESEPTFGEGDLCAPSDVAVVNVDGTDYLLVSPRAGSDVEEENLGKDYLFQMELFRLGIKKTNLSECSFYLRLKITGNGMGLYKGSNPAPRSTWEW